MFPSRIVSDRCDRCDRWMDSFVRSLVRSSLSGNPVPLQSNGFDNGNRSRNGAVPAIGSRLRFVDGHATVSHCVATMGVLFSTSSPERIRTTGKVLYRNIETHRARSDTTDKTIVTAANYRAPTTKYWDLAVNLNRTISKTIHREKLSILRIV